MKVKLDKTEVEVVKLPIGRYSELLEVFRALSTKINLSDFTTGSNKDILKMLPDLILGNLPEALKIIQIGTGLSQEEVSALGLNECIDLIMAIIEENKYADVYEKIKKGLARLPKVNTQVKPTGLPTQSTP